MHFLLVSDSFRDDIKGTSAFVYAWAKFNGHSNKFSTDYISNLIAICNLKWYCSNQQDICLEIWGHNTIKGTVTKNSYGFLLMLL